MERPAAVLLDRPSRRFIALRDESKTRAIVPCRRKNASVEEFLRPLKKTFSKRGVFFSAQIGELLQLRALLGIESRRDFHHNADKKIALLQKVDTRLQAAMQNVQDWLNGHGSPSSDGSRTS